MKIICVIILSLLLSIAALAQREIAFNAGETEKSVTTEKTESPAVTVETTGAKIAAILGARQKPLSLREAVEMALANNPDVEIARQTVRSAELDVTGARGAFDFRLTAAPVFERRRLPATSQFNSGPNGSALVETELTVNSRLEKPLSRFGTVLSTEFSATRSTTNSTFNDFRRSYPTALTFSLAQPIFRGRKADESRRRLEVAKRNLTLTDQQFRQRTIETIVRVEQAYWDLAFALKNLQVQQEAVSATEDQLASMRRRVESGENAPADLASIEAQIARFQIAVYAALRETEAAQNALKNLIAKDEKAEIWNEAILPADRIEQTAPAAVTLAEALDEAAKNRIEFKQNRTAQEINRINQKYLRDQTKPQFDLTASYSLQGFAGKFNDQTGGIGDALGSLTARVNQLSELANLPPLPTSGIAANVAPRNLNGGYGQSLGNLALNRFNVLQFGVTFSLPLENRTARAELGKSLVEADRLETERRRLAQNVQTEVRDAWTRLQTAVSRLDAAAKLLAASEIEYQSEQRKYEAGRAGTNISTVLDRRKELNEAQREEIAAQIEVNKARAELARVTGAASGNLSIFIR